MESPDGKTTTDLVKQVLPENIQSYNFYQVIELLFKIYGSPDDQGDYHHYPVHFISNPSLGFAASDISGLETPESGPPRLEVTFLGLSGAHSPLPAFYLEELLYKQQENLAGEGQWVIKELYDFFNHRFIVLLHQIWRKYRYYIYYQTNASDRFSSRLFALVGLADSNLRHETPLNWCKMLSYSGLIAGRSRSPQVVAGIISHYFDLPDVVIRSYIERKVTIPDEQRFYLGAQNSLLGQDSVLGQYIPDCVGKFIISVRNLSLNKFIDFLPIGKEHPVLLTLVEFILREQMAFDLELGLKEDEVPIMQLSSAKPAMLGWTSFMGKVEGARNVLIQARQ